MKNYGMETSRNPIGVVTLTMSSVAMWLGLRVVLWEGALTDWSD